MANERAKADLAQLMDAFEEQMRDIARVQQERANLTGIASVQRRRVTVVVNADGIVIETKFAADIDDLSFDDIARAVTAAAQEAAADAARKGAVLMEPLRERRAKLPNIEDMIEGLPNLRSRIPVPPPVPTTPPSLRDRGTEGLEFTNAEEYEAHRVDRGSTQPDPDW